MQYEPLCRSTQHLDSRNRQSNDWKTKCLIPRRCHILLHWVFLRLKIGIEDRFLPYLGVGEKLMLNIAWKRRGSLSENLNFDSVSVFVVASKTYLHVTSYVVHQKRCTLHSNSHTL